MWHLLPFDVLADVENVQFTIMQMAERYNQLCCLLSWTRN